QVAALPCPHEPEQFVCLAPAECRYEQWLCPSPWEPRSIRPLRSAFRFRREVSPWYSLGLKYYFSAWVLRHVRGSLALECVRESCEGRHLYAEGDSNSL